MTGLDNGEGRCEWGSPGLGAGLPTWELSGGGGELDDTGPGGLEEPGAVSNVERGEDYLLGSARGGAPRRERDVGRRSPGPGARGYRLADREESGGGAVMEALGTRLTEGSELDISGPKPMPWR